MAKPGGKLLALAKNKPIIEASGLGCLQFQTTSIGWIYHIFCLQTYFNRRIFVEATSSRWVFGDGSDINLSMGLSIICGLSCHQTTAP